MYNKHICQYFKYMFKKVIQSETRQHFAAIINVRIIGVICSIGLCLSSMGVVIRQENISRLFKNTFFVYRKKLFALSFVYFNSWPVILTALPAVMVASRRCETRS